MDEFWCSIIFGFIGLIAGLLLEFCIVTSTLNEGEYIIFRIKNTVIQSQSYYIKNVEKINDYEYKLLIKKRGQ